MIRLKSGLLALAAEFTGKYAPFQGVRLAPLNGGVSVAATNHGSVAMIAFDPNGEADEEAVILPDAQLVKVCRGIKTALREITIDGSLGTITTYHKAHSTSVEVPIIRSSVEFPPLAQVVKAAISYWGERPEVSGTAGRYDLDMLTSSLKALGGASSVVLASYQGGPLRLQREDEEVFILQMPQEATPIPAVPSWLGDFAASEGAPQRAIRKRQGEQALAA